MLYTLGGLGAWPTMNIFEIRCFEIASEAIFGPKQPLEQFFQYSDHKLNGS